MGYELFYFVGAIVLLAAIGYGVYRDKTRNRRRDALTEAATRLHSLRMKGLDPAAAFIARHSNFLERGDS